MIMKNNTLSPAQPFDDLAKSYDAEFTGTEIGKILRRRTREQMVKIFKNGDEVLEINCGTGEDASFLAGMGIRVTATDGSIEMIRRSKDKIAKLGLDDIVTVRHCSFEELDSVLESGKLFDGIISNFGGLNCAEDLVPIAAILAKRVKSGGQLFLCIMGRWTPWEWFYLGCKGKLQRIRDRLTGTGNWRGQTIRYYTPGRVIKIFNPHFEKISVSGLGFLLPPTYAGSLVTKFPAFFHMLNSIEKRLQSIVGIPQLSDHFMIVLRRR